MKLTMFTTGGAAKLGVIRDDHVVEVGPLFPDAPTDLMSLILAGPSVQSQVAALAEAPQGVPLSSVTLSLLIPRPGKILCLGLNYVEHAREGGSEVPDYPAVFSRLPSSMLPANAPILKTALSDEIDFEAELLVILGSGGKNIAEDEALSHVFGYTAFNDVSVRDYQRLTSQWTVGKNFDATGPYGPVVVTADELPAGGRDLRLCSRLNGKVMQDASTSDMVFSVARTISILSQAMTLEAGDLIATGTPSGVGASRRPQVFLRDGDVIEVEIEGIGTLSNPVVAEARA
ncbi:2-keto-4-pentenoate hydratase/2-oxohepta-3-ene-1,7-dioic acid hydratase (catechol pathway) [Devosia enhydra]|uniref:2-keto-4-pentenoate hydratase/2-oxohepta-3-ene-1,7-dioic acid hydratase (Catechol pathway) n=1 Tax=Devosia enhydra TaxID=665118 RepID=A0A1K2HYE9_9HYPH|nr:fumarylacetoacetate hydrolase family protein [Devosia enhydra]SFZ84593.1 2-keto-4-pentenoate hydratase/2-oxohepta-3-ene-1,7-dioic acid hydratase (catechol pathway) [Devosia enhydra]